VQALLHVLLLYLRYSAIVLALATVIAGGLWLWITLATWFRRDPDQR
jgi:hypothetical protein